MQANKEISPSIHDENLTTEITGFDHHNEPIKLSIITEKSITLFLNNQEIVTLMTIGDYPKLLGIGYLKNQCMLTDDEKINEVVYDEETQTIVVYTDSKTNYEEKLKKKITTSGCAQGVLYGDIKSIFDKINLDKTGITLLTGQLYALLAIINTTPSLYLKAGAIHGCVLCDKDRPLLYFEDVGRHNAVDKIAGYTYLNNIDTADKILYTTGRLTSEMILKTVLMGIPILVSRSGFTSSGVSLAQQADLTLIGRARGKRFILLCGKQRLIFDNDKKKKIDAN